MRGPVIAIGVIALMILGFLFLSTPAPTIIVAPETIFHIGALAVTNTMFTSWIVVLFLCAVAIIAGRSVSLVPSGFSGLIEAIVAGFFGVVEGVVGEARARQFFFLIATIFFYVITSNYFGLLPGNQFIGKPEVGHGSPPVELRSGSLAGIDVLYVPLNPGTAETHAAGDTHAAPATEGKQYGILAPFLRSVNTDVNTPLAIAIFSFIFVELWGFQALGPGYLKKFFNFSSPINIFVGLLELVSEFSRLISFTFRLFGNVFAGEVLLTMMGFLVPLVLIDVFYGLELFVGAIQAFVFAMLTLVFAQSAVAHHGDDHEEGHEAAH
ncbi:MAG: F0F1 ATP synthase subunit A [Dehalococcoidia bacterium]